MDKLNETPNIQIEFGGPALADEVYNDSEEIRIVVNMLIDRNENLEEAILYLASLKSLTPNSETYKRIKELLK